MQTRKPVVADQFYPGQYDCCIEEINSCIEEHSLPTSLPENITAGIVPHAGWAFSGSLAAMVFSAIKQQNIKVHTFVIFGAAHSCFGPAPAVYDRGLWQGPLGEVEVDQSLAQDVLACGIAVADLQAHSNEHSIEVQIPFVQHLFPDVKILPILTPPAKEAIELGNAIGDIIRAKPDRKIICIGSTDLTHYGPRYGFDIKGTGEGAIRWATEVNDKKFIDAALELDGQEILTTATHNCNACGAGAAAATVAVAKKLGKTKGVLLAHTNSNEIMKKKMGAASTESVGYAAIVF